MRKKKESEVKEISIRKQFPKEFKNTKTINSLTNKETLEVFPPEVFFKGLTN
jgi:hypothetical protein